MNIAILAIVVGIVTFLVATGLVLLGAAILDVWLSGAMPRDPASIETIRRIGVEARQGIDRASQSFLRRVEHLFDDQSRR